MVECEIAAVAPIGPGYRFSRRHTFDEEQVRTFARALGDEQALQDDVETAGGPGLGGLAASQTHAASLLIGLTASHFAAKGNVQGINFSMDLLRPVLAVETVFIEWNVTSIAARANGGCILELQGAITGAEGRTRVLAHGTVLFTPHRWRVKAEHLG